MPDPMCQVKKCKSNNDDNIRKELNYYPFPEEVGVRDEWIKRCKSDMYFNADNSHVCSLHFKEDDYLPLMEPDEIGTETKQLKPDAVPSLNLPKGGGTSSDPWYEDDLGCDFLTWLICHPRNHTHNDHTHDNDGGCCDCGDGDCDCDCGDGDCECGDGDCDCCGDGGGDCDCDCTG